MDVLVCVPWHLEMSVRARRLNPASGLTDGYWEVTGYPRYAKEGNRIWFALRGTVIASAVITDPTSEDPSSEFASIRFAVRSVVGHQFPAPSALKPNFSGFRYVRRARRSLPLTETQALDLVGAAEAKRLYPKSW